MRKTVPVGLGESGVSLLAQSRLSIVTVGQVSVVPSLEMLISSNAMAASPVMMPPYLCRICASRRDVVAGLVAVEERKTKSFSSVEVVPGWWSVLNIFDAKPLSFSSDIRFHSIMLFLHRYQHYDKANFCFYTDRNLFRVGIDWSH